MHKPVHLKQRGFTLIELMITVVVIGILASIAIPSYTSYIQKGRRADAQAFMFEVASRQQHFMADRRAYSTSITAAPSSSGLGLTVPSNVSTFYTLTITTDNAASPPTFSVKAVPAGVQATDSCGDLTLNHQGTKGAARSGCW